jgi:DNA-binding response OmpR family regulator
LHYIDGVGYDHSSLTTGDGAPSALLQGRRVLVAEDDPIIAMMLETMLADAGASEIVIAKTVKDADAHVSNGHFDLAIFDRQLRDGVSFDVAAAAKAKGAAVIIASGAMDLGLPDGLQSSAVLSKPYDVAAFLAAASHALSQQPNLPPPA